MPFYWLTLGILSVWRVTHLLNAEDGPWDIIVRIRAKAGASFFGRLLDCFYCLSVWIAAPVAWLLGQDAKEIALLWPALSGGVILLEKLTNRPAPPPPAVYWEDGGKNDVLREQEAGAEEGNTSPKD